MKLNRVINYIIVKSMFSLLVEDIMSLIKHFLVCLLIHFEGTKNEVFSYFQKHCCMKLSNNSRTTIIESIHVLFLHYVVSIAYDDIHKLAKMKWKTL